MKETLEVINKMQTAGIIERYAIGGAVGAINYLEAMSTEDIDIFVSISPPKGKLIASFGQIYDYLKSLGYAFKGQRLIVEGWPVEFLPADDPLYNEALLGAIETQIEETKTWVMTQEHLMAIALKTGRPKDFTRLQLFFEAGTFDPDFLNEILKRHNLLSALEAFKLKHVTT
jgi:hypothetical protein